MNITQPDLTAPSAPNPTQPPSIGRIVHYQSRGDATGTYPPVACAAIITAIHPNGTVSLTVFTREGFHQPENVPYSPTPKCAHWNYPPFVPPTKAT